MPCSFNFFFFFNDTATTEIYTLSLHDALPIFTEVGTSPEISNWGGMLVNSSVTGKPTSANGSEVYVAHNRNEMPSARSFMAALARTYFRRKRITYLRTAVRTFATAAGSTEVVLRRENISLRRSLRSSGARFVSIAPADAIEIEPVSSETATTTASLSSVTPMAARCRVPSCFEIRGFNDRGRKQPAAATRDPSTMTAPS